MPTTPLLPSERLIVRKLHDEIRAGYNTGTALCRVAQQLGVSRKRVLTVWVTHRIQETK